MNSWYYYAQYSWLFLFCFVCLSFCTLATHSKEMSNTVLDKLALALAVAATVLLTLVFYTLAF